MPEIRTLDTLKSIAIKPTEKVDSVAGQRRVTGPTWNPSVGLEARQKAEAEAFEKFKAHQESERQLDPTQIRIAQLETRVAALEDLVRVFVDRSMVDG